MDGPSRCQQCDAPLIGEAVGGLCANCLLKLALEPPAESTMMEEELPPASAEPAGLDPAVVQALKNALLLRRSPSVLTNVDPSLTRFIKVKDSDYDGLRKEMEKATRFGEVEN